MGARNPRQTCNTSSGRCVNLQQIIEGFHRSRRIAERGELEAQIRAAGHAVFNHSEVNDAIRQRRGSGEGDAVTSGGPQLGAFADETHEAAVSRTAHGGNAPFRICPGRDDGSNGAGPVVNQADAANRFPGVAGSSGDEGQLTTLQVDGIEVTEALVEIGSRAVVDDEFRVFSD